MTSRLLVPTIGPADWRRLLADPAKQWKAGRSAYEVAVAWESARRTPRGLPKDVADVLDRCEDLRDAHLLFGIPEHQVVLEGGGHASQTDLWALLRTPVGLVSMAVEGKAGEGFGQRVDEWLKDASPRSGKPRRLAQLCRILALSEDRAHGCVYQLLHRSAAAILEAQRFGIDRAVLLVHSFLPEGHGSMTDFKAFGEQLGVHLAENEIVSAGVRDSVQLLVGCITSAPATDAQVRAAVA